MTTDSVASSEVIDSQGVDGLHPWPGLSPYTEALTRFFHGRSREVDDLLRRVRRKVLTVLFGQSGLGKTSLLQAGLFPKLRQEGLLPVLVRLDHAAEAPDAALQIKAAIHGALAAAGLKQAVAPAAEETLWEYFHRSDAAVIGGDGKPASLVLVFDQFEELFTLGQTTAERRLRAAAFVDILAGLVENRAPAALEQRLEENDEEAEKFSFDRQDFRVLLCLREDFLAQLEGLRDGMPSLAANRMRLTRMNGRQALEAVIEPAAGLVAADVARQIVRFVAGNLPRELGSDAVPSTTDDLAELEVEPSLLSLVCRELNSRRLKQGLPHISADLLAGSSERILQDYYDRCMADQAPAVRAFVEDELLTDSGFRENMALERARKLLQQRGAAPEAIDVLVKRRLLHVQERLNVQRVELTHDVLTEVIRKSRDARQQHERVRALRKKLRRTRIRVAVILVSLVILGLVGLEIWTRTQLGMAYEKEKEAKADADLARERADISAQKAEVARQRADLSAQNAMEAAAKEAAARKELEITSERLRQASYFQNLSMAELTWQRGEIGRPRRLLQDCLPVHRHWEWYYLNLLTEPEVQTLKGHTDKVRRVAFSPDGRRLASASQDNTVKVWDLFGDAVPVSLSHADGVKEVIITAEGRLVTVADDGTVHLWDTQGQALPPSVKIPEAQKIVVSADGRRLATASAGTRMKLWDAATGRDVDLPTQTEIVNRVAFSPAGERLALAVGRTIKVVPTGGKQKPILLRGHPAAITNLTFSPDGRRLASYSDRTILVWDLNNPPKALVLEKHTAKVNVIAFRGDGLRLVSGGDDKTVRVWDLVLGEEVGQFAHTDWVDHVSYSPDGSKLASGCFDGTLRILHAESGQELFSNRAHPLGVSSLAFSPDGMRLASAGHDGSFKLWDVQHFKELASAHVPSDLFSRLVFSPSGQLLAGVNKDKTIRLWDGHTGKQVLSLAGQTGQVMQTVFSADSQRLTVACSDGTTRAWDLRTGVVERGFSDTKEPVGDCQTAISFDGRQVVCARPASQGISLWDLSIGKLIASPEDTRERIALLVFSPDGQRLGSVSEEGKAKLWNAANGELLGSLRLGDQASSSTRFGDPFRMAFSYDNQRVALASGDNVKILDGSNAKVLFDFRSHKLAVTNVAFSPDGKQLASASRDQTVKIWDLDRGQELRSWTLAEEMPELLFSPDGSLLAANSGKVIKVWDVSTGKALFTLGGHSDRVSHLAFSPDGRRLASASDDARVKLWTMAGPKQLLRFSGHTEQIVNLAFSQDGQRLASAGADKTVRVWDPGTGSSTVTIDVAKTAIKQVVFDPKDSKRLVIVNQRGAVQVFDAVTGKEHSALLTGPDLAASTVGLLETPLAPGPLLAGSALASKAVGWVNHVAFHPDSGALAVAGDDKNVKVWDIIEGKKLLELRGHSSPVYQVAYGPQGKYLASAGDDKTVYVWDGKTGQRICELQGPTGRIVQLLFSPDGQQLAARGEAEEEAPVRLWNLAKNNKPVLVRCGRVNDVAFSPDGRRLASASAGDDHTVKVWDTASGELVFTLKGHTAPVTRVAFSVPEQGSRLASASEDKTVKVWDVSAGRELLTLQDHSARVSHILFSPDGKRLASAGDDKMVLIWETAFDLPTLAQRERAWQGDQATTKIHDKQWFAAEFHLRQLLQGEDATAKWYSQRADVYAQQSRYDAALDDYTAAIKNEPDKAVHYYHKGMALLAMGDVERFRALCADMVQRFAKNTDASTIDYIAWLATLDPQGVSDFRGLAQLQLERAVTAHPDSADYLESLGAASFRAGNFPAALLQLEQAVARNGKGGTVWMQCFLAMTHYELKHANEAHLWLAKAGKQFVDSKDINWMSWVRGDRMLREAAARTGSQAFVLRVSDQLTPADAKDKDSKSFSKIYSVQLVADNVYQITMSRSLDSTMEPILRLEDAAGSQLSFNDSFGNSEARITFSCTRSDTYRIVATSYNGGVGKFTVAVLGKSRVRIALKNGKGQVEGRLTDLEIADYVVPLTAGKTYRVDLVSDEAQSGAASSLRLVDAGGKDVASEKNTAAARILFACDSSGEFRLVPGKTAGSGKFTLLIEEVPPISPARIVLQDGKARLQDELTLQDLKDKVRVGSFVKVYAVDLAAGKTYLMQMIRAQAKSKFEPYLHVEDAKGKRVAADDSYGLVAAQVVVACDQAGTFRISATSFERDIGNYTLVVQEWAPLPEVKITLKDGTAKLAGKLDSTDLKNKANPESHCKVYLLKMAAGKLYGMEMTSNVLECSLRLEDPSGIPLVTDQDKPGVIAFRASLEGTYRLFASTLKPQTGTFALTIHEKELPIVKIALKDGKVSIKDELTKSDLKDSVRTNSYYKAYSIALSAGRTYQIDMKSDKVDSYLRLEDDKGKSIIEDDDSGGFPDARIVWVCPQSGTYRIIATTYGKDEKGSYSLTVQEK